MPKLEKVNALKESFLIIRKELLKTVPVVPYFPGLFYWDKEEVGIGNGVNREHRFFGSIAPPTLPTQSFDDVFMCRSYYSPKPPTPEKTDANNNSKPVEDEEYSPEKTKQKLAELVEKKRKLNQLQKVQEQQQKQMKKKKPRKENPRSRLFNRLS